MDRSPQIGIVIPSFNDRPFLDRLFESLYSTDAGASFLPVVVDDQSDDGSEIWMKEALRGYAVVIRPKEKCYFTRANNAGLHWHQQNTHPNFYFLLNSDIVVTDGWAGALVATSVKLNAGIIGATLLYPDGRVQHAGAYGKGQHFQINDPWVKYYEDRLVPWVTGAALCIRKDVLEDVGFLPFPTEAALQYDASDRGYCTRARLMDYEVAVSAGCVLYHFTHQAEAERRKLGQYDSANMQRIDR